MRMMVEMPSSSAWGAGMTQWRGQAGGTAGGLRVRAETKVQAAAIHAHKLLERYEKPNCNRSVAVEAIAISYLSRLIQEHLI